MLSSALVIFREAFEIVLIVGVILAATRGMPHRNKAIYMGFVGGLLGSALVAFFTGAISDFAHGVGQEYFNAAILFTAAGFIGWTVLWMKRHAREMKANFEKVGKAVSDGDLPFFSLSLVIALAILREGSEIALITHGMLAAGQSVSSVVMGSAIGLVAGAGVGLLLYMGLIKLSVRYFFQVTSWLLVFLVAGMMSQGVGFLSASGAFENLSMPLWDSSWLLKDGGIIGESLGVLVGYTARPTAIQLIVYSLTLGTLVMLMKRMEYKMKPSKAVSIIVMAIGLGAFLIPTQAHASKKIYAPYVERGELEFESRTGYDFDSNSSKDGAWKEKLAVGYGVNDYWFTEFYTVFEKNGASGADPELSKIEWANKFQLSQPGEYFLDVGFYGELKYNTSGGADKGEGMLLFAKDVGKFSHWTNLILEREFGEGARDEWEAGIAWSSRYRYKLSFEPGFEIYSNFGSLSNGGSYGEQKHQIGPVIYGKVGHVKYDVGYLFGASDAAPDGMLKAVLEYEISF